MKVLPAAVQRLAHLFNLFLHRQRRLCRPSSATPLSAAPSRHRGRLCTPAPKSRLALLTDVPELAPRPLRSRRLVARTFEYLTLQEGFSAPHGISADDDWRPVFVLYCLPIQCMSNSSLRTSLFRISGIHLTNSPHGTANFYATAPMHERSRRHESASSSDSAVSTARLSALLTSGIDPASASSVSSSPATSAVTSLAAATLTEP